MNNNKPKKVVIGESKVMHVHKGFAIPVIVLFMITILIFSFCWGGVMLIDATIDYVVNPVMHLIDPEAEPIDIMTVMNPPTSESEAAKVYAKFPTLDTDAIGAALSGAFDDLPESWDAAYASITASVNKAIISFKELDTDDTSAMLQWAQSDLVAALSSSVDALGEALPTLPEDFSLWYDGEMSPAIGKALEIVSNTINTYPAGIEAWYNDHLPFRSIIFNTNQDLEGIIEKPYSEVQNRLAATAHRFTQAVLVFLDQAPATNNPQGPGNTDLEDPFFDPDNPNDPSQGDENEDERPPEFPTDEKPPEFEEETETGGDNEGQGGTAVCEHSYDDGVIETPATCTEWGVLKYTCQKCNKEKREYTKKIPHDYVEAAHDVPLCGEHYTVSSTCSLCNDTKTETLVKSHVKGNEIKTVSPSYTSYGYTLVKCADCEGEYRTNLKNKLYYEGFFMPTYRSDTVYEGRDKWLFYRGNDSEAYFKGTNLMTDTELQEYVSVMNTLNDICKERGITLQICIWPNKEQVYYEYTGLTPETNTKRVDLLVEYVRANSDLKIIYPLKELKAMKPYYDMYLKYDTHWNCAGGFVGYQEMLESLGLDTVDIRNAPVYEYTGKPMDKNKMDKYYTQISGDMIGLGNLSSSNYNGDHNYCVLYRPEVTVDTFSGANGAGDTRHTTAANATNDCNFVMLADSYRVMQLSYLEKDFSDCFLTHRSHVNDADVKEAIKNSDILVIAAVERLETDILATARHIINILQEDAQ